MADNPYEPPSDASLAGISSYRSSNALTQELGCFICSVLILDCIPSLIKLVVCVVQIINGRAANIHHHSTSLQLIFWTFLVVMPVFVLSGNILILLKNKFGIPIVFISAVLAIISYCRGFWILAHRRPPLSFSESTYFSILVTNGLLFAGWLILYGFVIWMAAKELGWIRTYDSLKEYSV